MLEAAHERRARRRRRGRRRRRNPRPRRNRGAARRPRRHSARGASSIAAPCSRRWTSTPSWRAARSSCWSTSWRTPTRPGSRHPKRFSDVEELLDAGIDVYTTVNIQHLESLNDVVAQITGIRVRETVPDRFFERADELKLVDVTPEDLLQRLQDGKVYMPAAAERAIRNYFRPGNLTALRELALRHTAERVDDQMRTYMQAHAVRRRLAGRRAHHGGDQRRRAGGAPDPRRAPHGRPAPRRVAGGVRRDRGLSPPARRRARRRRHARSASPNSSAARP